MKNSSIVMSFTHGNESERVFHCVCYLSCNQSLPKLFPRTRTVRCVTRENIQKDNSIYRILYMPNDGWAKILRWKFEKLPWLCRVSAIPWSRIGHVIFDLSFLFGGSLMLHFPPHLFFRDSFIDNLPAHREIKKSSLCPFLVSVNFSMCVMMALINQTNFPIDIPSTFYSPLRISSSWVDKFIFSYFDVVSKSLISSLLHWLF